MCTMELNVPVGVISGHRRRRTYAPARASQTTKERKHTPCFCHLVPPVTRANSSGSSFSLKRTPSDLELCRSSREWQYILFCYIERGCGCGCLWSRDPCCMSNTGREYRASCLSGRPQQEEARPRRTTPSNPITRTHQLDHPGHLSRELHGHRSVGCSPHTPKSSLGVLKKLEFGSLLLLFDGQKTSLVFPYCTALAENQSVGARY